MDKQKSGRYPWGKISEEKANDILKKVGTILSVLGVILQLANNFISNKLGDEKLKEMVKEEIANYFNDEH